MRILLLPIIAGLASVCPKEVVCREAADRDMRLMLVQNGLSHKLLLESVFDLIDGIDSIDAWLAQSDRSLKIGYFRLFDTTVSACIADYFIDTAFREIRDEMRKSRYRELTGRPNRELSILVWLANNQWLLQGKPTERRIFVDLTSSRPLIGNAQVVVQQDLKYICPMEDTPTMAQFREAVRKQAIGVYVFLWQNADGDFKTEVEKWNEYMAEAEITDYKIFGTKGSEYDGKPSGIFKDAICTMAAPSYLATTTTFTP